MQEQLYFPLFVDLKGKKIVIIGGGAVAARRVRTLLLFGCEIIVIAPEIKQEMWALFQQYGYDFSSQNDTCSENSVVIIEKILIWKRRVYEDGDCSGAFLAVAATNCREVNKQIGQQCKMEDCFVSVADKKEESTFYFPAIATNGAVVVGITSSGTNHTFTAAIARQVRECIK